MPAPSRIMFPPGPAGRRSLQVAQQDTCRLELLHHAHRPRDRRWKARVTQPRPHKAPQRHQPRHLFAALPVHLANNPEYDRESRVHCRSQIGGDVISRRGSKEGFVKSPESFSKLYIEVSLQAANWQERIRHQLEGYCQIVHQMY